MRCKSIKTINVGSQKEIVLNWQGKTWFHPLEMNINQLVYNFYALVTLEGILRPVPFRPSHERLLQDLREYKEWFCEIFAGMLYDYTALALFAELRHAKAESLAHVSDPDMPGHGDSREKCFLFPAFRAHSIYQVAKLLFNPFYNEWESSYGGEAWYQIACTGDKYHVLPNEVYIDHCVDLEHNNGCYFDKSGGVFYLQSASDLEYFLNRKRDAYASPRVFLKRASSIEIQRLILRAHNLGMIDKESDFNDNFKFTAELLNNDYLCRVSPVCFTEVKYVNHFYKLVDGRKSTDDIQEWSFEDLLMNYHRVKFGITDMSLCPILDEYGDKYYPKSYLARGHFYTENDCYSYQDDDEAAF